MGFGSTERGLVSIERGLLRIERGLLRYIRIEKGPVTFESATLEQPVDLFRDSLHLLRIILRVC